MQPHRVCQPLEMCWFHGQRCSFLPLPDWNFVFYHECLHCCMWNVKDLSQTLTAYLFPFDATLCKTLIYLSSPSSFNWLPVPIFSTNFFIEVRTQKADTSCKDSWLTYFFFVVFTTMPCIFSCKFWSLPCFFYFSFWKFLCADFSFLCANIRDLYQQ